ncbi:MAG: hypothetical protein JO307_27395 [Bryobacterales bacterium]|nr:hypothetical protein [Bryobacterales bacterium]MBV9401450.1 hypothetical protein [Bryobacterales bacterium]
MWWALPALICGGTSAQVLTGVIDIHAHTDPDSTPRSIDAIDLAKLAKSRGMRGLVLKNHYESTASLAYIVRKEVPGLEVFGGIDLNLTVGGINPAAVERMTMVNGGWGRVVWMPTFDAENQVRDSKENRPFVPIAKNGELLPDVKQVIGVVAKHNLLLETGHSSPEEGLMLIREAKRQNVQHVVVTHATRPPVRMSIAQMQEAAKLGAYIEFVYDRQAMADTARAIRAIGPEYCILSSDLGQPNNPLHPDGLEAFFAGLEKEGISRADIERMTQKNPAVVLGLP